MWHRTENAVHPGLMKLRSRCLSAMVLCWVWPCAVAWSVVGRYGLAPGEERARDDI